MKLIIEDRIAYLLVDNENAGNTLGFSQIEEFNHLVQEASESTEVDVLALTNNRSPVFSLGASVEVLVNSVESDRAGSFRAARTVQSLGESLLKCNKLTVCAYNGNAAGAAFEIGLLCDFMLAKPKCKFNFAYIGLGITADYGCINILAERIGKTRSNQLFFSNKKITSEELADYGVLALLEDDSPIRENISRFCKPLLRRVSNCQFPFAKNRSMLLGDKLPNFEDIADLQAELFCTEYVAKNVNDIMRLQKKIL